MEADDRFYSVTISGERQQPPPRGVHFDRTVASSQHTVNLWERPADEPVKSAGSKCKNRIAKSALLQGCCGAVMVFMAALSDANYGWSYRFTNFDTGGRLIDLQWVYSLSTLALGIAAFYLWTRYWLLFQSNEAGLLTAIKYYLLAYVVTWLLGLWTVVTLLVNFPDVSDTVEWESTDLHAYLVTDLIFLFAYLILGLNYKLSLFVSYHQLTEKLEIEGTIRTVEPFDGGATGDVGDGSTSRSTRKEDHDGRVAGGTVHQLVAPSAPEALGATLGRSGRRDEYQFSEYLSPMQFEDLWTRLPTAGQFQAQLSSSVPSKDGLVDHLSERGFQVVAAGVSEQDMRVLFCARQGRSWFLAEMSVHLGDTTLHTLIKAEDASVVGPLVRKFELDKVMNAQKPR